MNNDNKCATIRLQVDYIIPPTLYILLAKRALSLFADTTRSDLIIVSYLYQIDSNSSFTMLYKAVELAVTYTTFGNSLKRCTNNQYIARERCGRSMNYCITTKGIDLLMRYNDALHRMALEQYNRYH